MKKNHVSILLVALYGVLFALTASAKSYSELQTLVDGKKYAEAFELAETLSEAENGEPEFDLLYGIAARESEHPELAIFAFERILMQDKTNARAQYEMALALIKVSDFRGAKAALNMVFANRPSEVLKGNSERLLSIVDKGVQRYLAPMLVFKGTFEVGYNDNVNSSSSEILSIPPGPRQGDGFAQLAVDASLLKFLNKKDAVYFLLSSINRKNFSSQTYDFNAIGAGVGFRTQVAGINISLPYIFDVSISNYLPSIFSNALGFELGKEWTENHETLIGANLKHKSYTRLNNNHLLAELVATYKGRYFHNSLKFEGGFSYEPVLAVENSGVYGSSIKNVWGAFGKLKYNFLPSHQIFAKAKFRNSDFWLVPLDLSARRNDSNVNVDVGYWWHLSKSFSVGPSYSFVRNSSNKLENTYSRHQVQLGLDANF